MVEGKFQKGLMTAQVELSGDVVAVIFDGPVLPQPEVSRNKQK
jgi:hypothetical protein